MKKPIIFISHSSKDERMVRKLKELLTKKVGNTIDIFVSSDGQSIPLGRNWVYEIEQALTNSKIVFVLLSTNSVRSNWTYFEAGYAYSKDIKVIPVGVQGIDLSQIQPPMSLLQGFNINSLESLNNLISILNKEFDYSLEASFNQEEYANIFGIRETKTPNLLGEHASLVNEIGAEVLTNIDKPIEEIGNYFKSSKLEYKSDENLFDTYGMSIIKSEKTLYIKLDPDLVDLTMPLLGEVFKIIQGGDVQYYPLTIDFTASVGCIQEKHKRSAKLYNTEIKILDNSMFIYSDIGFDVSRKVYYSQPQYAVVGTTYQAGQMGVSGWEYGPVSMEIKYFGKNLAQIPIHNLLTRLFDLGILY